MVMTTFFSVQRDTSAVSDLRGWSEQQLIAAAKTGRRAPFGELCERHRKRISYVTRRIIRNREDAEDAAQECIVNAIRPSQGFWGKIPICHKWMIRLIEEFRFGVVPQVYFTDHLGCTGWSLRF